MTTFPHIESYTDLGGFLRHTREEHGIDVAQAAHHLFIRAKYLQAMEDGRMAELPGAAYAKGYLASYAEYLGLDRDQVLASYQRLGENRRHAFYLPETRRHGNLPSHWLLILSCLLLAGLYGGWYAYRGDPPKPVVINEPPVHLSYLFRLNPKGFGIVQHPCVTQRAGHPICYYPPPGNVPLLAPRQTFSTELVLVFPQSHSDGATNE